MTDSLAPLQITGGMILRDEVYSSIGAAILDGNLPPGARVRDVELAEQLGVSRTPVREALQRLERVGLVEVVVGRYTRVSAPSDQLRHDTGEFTVYLLGSALNSALRNCSDTELADLLTASDAVIASVRTADGELLFDASTQFFQRVTLATGNRVITGAVRETAFAIERNLRGWPPFVETALTRIDGYERLRECIARRDGNGAEAALRYVHGMS